MPSWGEFFGGTAPGGAPAGYHQVTPLAEPRFEDLYNTARGAVPTSMPSLESLISGGVNSPLLAAILGPALARLRPGEEASRQSVTDAARAAGGLRGTAYGQAYARNEGNILQNQSGLISDVIARTLSTLVPAQLQEQRNMFLPAESYMNLLRTIRPDVLSDRNYGGGFGGGSYGGGGLGDLGFEESTSDWLRRVQPTYGGGFAGTGVNTPVGGGGIAAPQPAPPPYGGIGFDGSMGGYSPGAAPPLEYDYGGGWTTNPTPPSYMPRDMGYSQPYNNPVVDPYTMPAPGEYY